jgi:hypothetical protein
MKKYTQKDVTKAAYRIAFSPVRMLSNGRNGFKHYAVSSDMRYSFWKEVKREYTRITQGIDNRAILEKQRDRARMRSANAFANVLSNPLFKDWKANKSRGIRVHPDRLAIGSRNHWAKTEADRKVLAILAKY